MKQALVFDGTKIYEEGTRMHNKLFKRLFLNTLLTLLNVTVILSLLLIFRIKEIARKMTHKIIWVYQTLEDVIKKRKANEGQI